MAPQNNRKLLLSSVCQPFGAKYGDGFGVSYEGTHQLMWAQGIFRPRTTTTQWGIDFIAENLEIPTTTLHYPTMERFVEEIKKGYEFVGIAFVSPTLHKMVPMVEAIRRHAPGSKIILGGYGTALGDEIAPYADHICHGEGVAFMRELLGERVDAPLRQPTITQKQYLFSLPLQDESGYVFAGLGCPNGCDFCATSHYFKRKHVAILPDGPSILQAILRLREKFPQMTSFWINDEDFLLNQQRGRGFLEAIRKTDVPPLSLSIFSSVKALSQYTPSELVEMGIDWIWVGYEGQRAGYSKMDGRPYSELFPDLHRHGISVMASMIIGFDYQTPEIIEQEFQDLMSLRPTMCQFLIYGAPHGTPSYERLESEGRLDPVLYAEHNRQDGFYLGFKHPCIGSDEMVAIQRDLYHREFALLGPGVFRVGEDWVTGYETLHDSSVSRVRAKARKYIEDARRCLMIIPASKPYLGHEVGLWLDEVVRRIEGLSGPMTVKEKLLARLAPAILAYTELKLRNDIGQQPQFTSKSYRMEPVSHTRDWSLNGLLSRLEPARIWRDLFQEGPSSPVPEQAPPDIRGLPTIPAPPQITPAARRNEAPLS